MVSLLHERAVASVIAETQQLYAGLQMSAGSADTCKSLGHQSADTTFAISDVTSERNYDETRQDR
jgi:hypothetical protein